MNKTVARLLGEAAPLAIDAPGQPEAHGSELEYTTNPTVERLFSMWQGGNHEAVALRILDALDQYEDFMELAFKIGQDGAIELGRIMDQLTSGQTSPHRYDELSDQDIPLKIGKNPKADNVQLAAGDSE